MYKLSNIVERKFVDTLRVSDWEIESETGWVDITHINKTIEYEVYQLTTTNCFIECADTHIVFTANNSEIFVKDLSPGDLIKGAEGIETVVSITKTDRKESMYDLSVTGNHTYYADGLLHHNTTTTAAFICWYILFNDEKTVAILANKAQTAREILQRVETAYEFLPKWMQSGVVEWNKGSVALENGSRVLASATSSSAIRGYSISLLYLDEFAHVENHVADEFFTSVFPTLSSGKETKILMSSTPNGYNMFYKFWTDAEKGINGFIHQRFDWWEHPERDQKWADEQKAVLGELKYTQEVGMEFLGSSKTLLTGETLRALAYRNPDFQHAKGEYKGLKIYEKPDVDRKYVMTVDVSRGRHLDSSAFGIFDVTEYPHKIVATYNNADIAPLMYSAICYNMAKKYNDAYILVEINDIGGQVAEEIYYTYEYGEMFWTKTGDVLGKQGADDYPGIRTTKKTKRIGCANLKDIIEKKQLIVDDWQMIQELATFVQSDSGNWEADEGFRDDSVAVLWLFAWLVMQPWFSDLTDKDIRSRMYSDKVREMEDELMPPTIITSQDWINEESPEYLGLRELL